MLCKLLWRCPRLISGWCCRKSTKNGRTERAGWRSRWSMRPYKCPIHGHKQAPEVATIIEPWRAPVKSSRMRLASRLACSEVPEMRISHQSDRKSCSQAPSQRPFGRRPEVIKRAADDTREAAMRPALCGRPAGDMTMNDDSRKTMTFHCPREGTDDSCGNADSTREI